MPEGAQPPASRDDEAAERRLMAFFETNREFFALYAEDKSINVRPSRQLGTFAIDLKEGTLYGDPSYYEKKGLTEGHAFDSFLHEFEHFRRLMTALRERGGLEKWKRHRERLKAKPRLKIFDNVLEDISVDRAKVSRAPSTREAQEDLYHAHLWPDRDFTKLPRHLQFIYALFRETMLPDEPVEVAEEVRVEIEKLRRMKNTAGQSLIEVMSHPDLPQLKRWALQERFFEPVYERLFAEDVRDEEGKGEKGAEGEKGEKGEGGGMEEGKPQEETEEGEAKPGAGEPGKEPSGKPARPDDYFKDQYDAYHAQSPDAAISEEEWDKAVEEALKAVGRPKTPEEMAAEAYALEAGVSLSDLQAYQRFWETVEQMRDPETDETVVEELRAAFRKIVAERLEPTARPKQPVEEGEYLVRPAEAVAEIKAGRTEPRVWMTFEDRERPKELYGAFDVTVVCDRSGSMEQSDGTAVKRDEQRKAAAMVLESLREFCDDLEEKRKDLRSDLKVRSEVWGFGGPSEVGCLKPLSEELTDRERVAVFKVLATTPGKSTRDDLALKAIRETVPDEDWERVRRGELRKVVMVFTDGDSSNPEGVKAELKEWRGQGAFVVVVGITEAAQAALRLYKPDAKLAKTAAQVGVAVADILGSHLAALNG